MQNIFLKSSRSQGNSIFFYKSTRLLPAAPVHRRLPIKHEKLVIRHFLSLLPLVRALNTFQLLGIIKPVNHFLIANKLLIILTGNAKLLITLTDRHYRIIIICHRIRHLLRSMTGDPIILAAIAASLFPDKPDQIYSR